jgi:hypothetical protein
MSERPAPGVPARVRARPGTFSDVGVLGRLRISFWLIIAGSIVLYGFFVALASIPPRWPA